MSFADEIGKSQEKEMEWMKKQAAKMGDYVDMDCPNCDRHRVMKGDDGKRRCEKCCWCVEDDEYDTDFSRYMR